MHISPLSSLPRAGSSSTVIENSIGQMLAKPRPAASTEGTASGAPPNIRPRAPASPRAADRRKNARGLITVSTAPPTSRPTVSIRKKNGAPNLVAAASATPASFISGSRKRPMHASAPT